MMWPDRFKAGAVDEHIVANIDFAPTIFEACGIVPPSTMPLDGRSMMPVLLDDRSPWRDALMLENGHTRAVVTDHWKYVALRYPPDVQAKIDEVERTGDYPRMTRKAELFFEKFRNTLTPEQWKFARNSWRWHTSGNNYMKSIDDFPFQFDADQLFAMSDDALPQDTANVAQEPENAEVLADMKRKLTELMAPLGQSFGEFGIPYSTKASPETKKRKAKAEADRE
jgi:arylsulfatase A-like enzyme